VSWLACWSAPALEAHLVKGFLEHRGVPCLLKSEGPSIYPVPAFGVRVLVPEDWLPVAQKLLARRRRPRRNEVVPLRRRKERA
jgi:Putative prokaryotic signal transducing protein